MCLSRHILNSLIRNCFIHVFFFFSNSSCLIGQMTYIGHSVTICWMDAWIHSFLILWVCVCACARVHSSRFSSIQPSLGFWARVRCAFAPELYSTLPRIKRNIFRLSKERDWSSFYLCCRCPFIYMLFIPFQTECHKNIHFIHIFSSLLLKCKIVSVLNDWGGQTVSHIFLSVSFLQSCQWIHT